MLQCSDSARPVAATGLKAPQAILWLTHFVPGGEHFYACNVMMRLMQLQVLMSRCDDGDESILNNNNIKDSFTIYSSILSVSVSNKSM